VTAAQLVGRVFGTIGRDPNEPLASLLLTVGEVAGQLLLGNRALASQVALELQHCLAQERVHPTMDLGERVLEVNVGARRPQAVYQKVVDQSADFLVAGATG
jgi:hypothetical protein